MPKESMPLAAGYLKANALQSDVIRGEMEVRIFNFGGGDPVTMMAETMFAEGVPDVLAFSVLGWSYYSFGHITECFKQIQPEGWVVWGGTHVAHQAHRVFRQFPEVDVVVNSEGEFVFREILLAYLGGVPSSELHAIPGVSFRDPEGVVVTTKEPERILDLDSIASPFLTERHSDDGRDRRVPVRRGADGVQPRLPVQMRVLLTGAAPSGRRSGRSPGIGSGKSLRSSPSTRCTRSSCATPTSACCARTSSSWKT